MVSCGRDIVFFIDYYQGEKTRDSQPIKKSKGFPIDYTYGINFLWLSHKFTIVIDYFRVYSCSFVVNYHQRLNIVMIQPFVSAQDEEQYAI